MAFVYLPGITQTFNTDHVTSVRWEQIGKTLRADIYLLTQPESGKLPSLIAEGEDVKIVWEALHPDKPSSINSISSKSYQETKVENLMNPW